MGTLMCPRFAPQLSIQVPDAVRVMYSRVVEMLLEGTVTQRSAHDDDVQATRDFATLMDRALYSPAIWLHKQIHHTKTSKDHGIHYIKKPKKSGIISKQCTVT